MKGPFFYAVYYWELQWLYPIIKKSGWPVLADSEEAKEFCAKFQFETITIEQARDGYDKLVLCVVHYGQHKNMVNEWWDNNKQIFVIQRAFDTSILIYNEFWGALVNRFMKCFIASQFDHELLQPKYGDKIIFSGSPRLHMANIAPQKNLSEIYKKVGTNKFFVVTVIGGLPIHEDSLVDFYHKQLPLLSPIKLVYKLHHGADLGYYNTTYPENYYWVDAKDDVWETYKLVAASQGVITPSSFLAIEATIMKKPVIFYGDVHPDEYARQAGQKQELRLPRDMSSSLVKPEFTSKQAEIRSSYKFGKESTDKIIFEILN